MEKRSFNWIVGSLALAVVGMALSSCSKHSRPGFIYMPDMVYSPAFKAQEGQMRVPPEGTIPRGFTPYHYTSQVEAGRELLNPLTPTHHVLARGQVVFNTFCITCHGPAGEGDGPVVPKMPRPPSLQSDKLRQAPDGLIFHIITRGQNIMPSYASQIGVEDRWAAIHYIRALQRAKHPTPEDLKAAQEQAGG